MVGSQSGTFPPGVRTVTSGGVAVASCLPGPGVVVGLDGMGVVRIGYSVLVAIHLDIGGGRSPNAVGTSCLGYWAECV
jgi:hypothetical protein